MSKKDIILKIKELLISKGSNIELDDVWDCKEIERELSFLLKDPAPMPINPGIVQLKFIHDFIVKAITPQKRG